MSIKIRNIKPGRFASLAGVALIWAAAGCTGLQEALHPEPFRFTTGSIRGRILDQATRSTLNTGRVRLLDKAGNPVEDQASSAWVSDGAFQFSSVLPGKYRLRPEVDGYRAADTIDVVVNIGETIGVEVSVTKE